MVALCFYLFNLLLQFISRKVFIDYLGTEVLGLNTTIVSILQFFNLAELGIGPAVATTLYKPVRDNNYQAINEILSVQGRLYKVIATIVIAGSAVALLFFPRFFSKADIPIWYAYATYLVLLFGSLLGYFYNYKQVLLSADQQDYKIQISYKLAMLIKYVFQIAAVIYFDNGYLCWIILEFVFAIVGAVWLNILIYRSYPFLKESTGYSKGLIVKYSSIITKVKQLFFHKISTYVLSQVSPLIIYAYATLTLVSIYGNYMLIIMGLVSLLAAVSNGLNGGVGNLVAEGDSMKIMKVFRELFSVRFFMVATVTYGFWMFADCFIIMWVGSEMLLDKKCLLLLSFILFCNTFRPTVDSFLNAYGLFKDIWAPIVEAIINLGLSIVLGSFMGLTGILVGVSTSLIFMVVIWKPIFLYHNGFKKPIIQYYTLFFKHVIICLTLSFFVTYLGQIAFPFDNMVLKSLTCIFFYAIIIFGVLLFSEVGMRNFVSRFIKISQ